jgi:hypothetical protein
MKKTMASSVSLIALLLGLFASPSRVLAGSQIFDDRDTCTGINCNSDSINGTYLLASTNSQPFILQVYSSGNECVRLDVTSQGTDLEMVLVSPNGTVWRNDDRAGSLLPLIKANTFGQGWYTLQVAHFNAFGGPSSNFNLRYGRYNSGNPNCSGATVPLPGSGPEVKPSVDEEGVSPSDGPSSREE